MVGVLDLNVGITNTNEANMAHALDAGLPYFLIRAGLAAYREPLARLPCAFFLNSGREHARPRVSHL